jgi:hypothetical protein
VVVVNHIQRVLRELERGHLLAAALVAIRALSVIQVSPVNRDTQTQAAVAAVAAVPNLGHSQYLAALVAPVLSFSTSHKEIKWHILRV